MRGDGCYPEAVLRAVRHDGSGRRTVGKWRSVRGQLWDQCRTAWRMSGSPGACTASTDQLNRRGRPNPRLARALTATRCEPEPTPVVSHARPRPGGGRSHGGDTEGLLVGAISPPPRV